MSKQVSSSIFKEKDTWSRVLTLVVVLVVVIVGIKIYKTIMKAGSVAAEAFENSALQVSTGIPSTLIDFIRGEAARLWDEGVTNYFAFKDYDEEMFVGVINDIGNKAGTRYPKALALLNEFYKEKSGQTIGEVISASFDSSDKKKVNSSYLSAL